MQTMRLAAGIVALITGGCAATRSGVPLSNFYIGDLSFAGRQVAFDHDCPEDHVRIIRAEGPTIDLDVCGAVRRYKVVAGPGQYNYPVLLDVTSAYPVTALPAPLPPDATR
jgi:hypothetical protein